MRRLVASALLATGLVAAVPLLAEDQPSPEQQKDWFVGFVEGQLSTPDRQIRISNIDGALSSTASIREITISDQQGVWLRVNDAAIDWDQGALFGGRLLVRSLSAGSIQYLRNAIPSGDRKLPSPEASALQVPDFPVGIQLDKLSVPKVIFGESVFGLGSEISLDGSLKLEGGSLTAALNIVRLDGPGGRLDTNVSFTNADRTIDLALTLTEPPNGIVANLLNIEGKPEVALEVKGAGPVDNLTTTMTLDAGGRRALAGSARIAEASGGLAIDADLGGPIAGLVAPPYRPFFGTNTALKASALLRSAGGLDISRFALSGGQLSLEASGTTTDDGFLSRLALEGRIADTSGGRVVLPVPGAATSIANAEFTIDYGREAAEGWTAAIAASGFANAGLKASALSFKASGAAANLEDAANRRLTFNADGTITGITASDPDVQAALGDSLGFGAAGLWNAGGPIQLAELRLAGKALSAGLSGRIENSVFDGDIGIETSSIAPFSGVAGRELDGALSLKAKGTVSPLNGGFDLTLDGTANHLALSEPALDKVLAGEVRLTGRVARTEKGLEAEGFRLENPNLRVAADGAIATGTADFRFSAALADLSLVSAEARGALTVTGTAKGQGAIALDLAGRIPTGQLAGKNLRDAGFGFKGNLTESGTLTGNLSGDAFLEKFRVSLGAEVAADAQTRRLSGLNFAAGPTTLSGELAQGADGLLSGRLDLASTDISTAAAFFLVDATGSANGSIVLAPAGDRQTASFTLSGRGIDAAAIREFGITPLQFTGRGSFAGEALTLEAFSATGAGGLKLTASGQVPLEGRGLELAIDGSAPLALADRFVADRGGQLSGVATLAARVNGSLAAPQLSGTVSTAGAGYVDPALNLRLVDINGSARLAGDRVELSSLAAKLATGGSISAGGSIGLDDGNPVDVAVRLNSARYADGNLFVTTLTGDLALRGRLMANPVLSGSVEVEKADITVPDSFGGAAALVEARHIDPPIPVARTLERASPDAGAPRPQRNPSVVQLDIAVSAPNQIFVRGRGLDAEVGGSVRLTGTVTDIQPVGAFTLNRGRLALLGQRITFDEGSVTLVGDLNPFLDFVARTEGEGVTVFVNVRGRVAEPEITFTSSPALPQDEVLSRLLFKRSMGELTPLQLAKLAGAAAELAGGSSSLVDSLRAKAGLADLDIVTGADGNLAVQAGTYLDDNIYLGVEAGADGNSRVTVNLDLTDDIKAKASAGTDGNSAFGVFYEKDY